MRTFIFVLILIFAGIAGYALLRKPDTQNQMVSSELSSSDSPRVRVIKTFYQKYFQFSAADRPFPGTKNLPLSMTQSLLELGAKTEAACKKQALQEVCGWGRLDGDLFLQAQETGNLLTFENTGISVIDGAADSVVVRLNVYPPLSGSDYMRTIRYKMILEDGEWRVDDISSEDNRPSLREAMLTEIKEVNQEKTR